jgi:hypothetical protein
MCIKYEAGKLGFTPSCSLELLTEQKRHMGMYLHCLEVRAEIEGISLEHIGEDTAYKKYIGQGITCGGDVCNSTSGVEHNYLKCNVISCDKAPEAIL